jgi:1-acyl-sn-glycerol-3-phosphate acyltransferase
MSIPAASPRARRRALAERLARLLLRVFFRSVEVSGAERVPARGPVVLVANHHNSLIDPALVLGFLPRRPRFLAKSTLWRIPGIRQLLELAAVIPVVRRQDVAEGEDPSRNLETFARCHEALAAGDAIALFPEGVSHDAPHLAPLKTGAARIGLEAEERFGPLGVTLVPVGLTFDAKGRFRSRALVRVGEPIDVASWRPVHRRDRRAAVRDLTEAIRTGLEDVTLNYESHHEARGIERVSEILATEDLELPARMALEEAFAMRRDALATARQLREAEPEALRRVARRLARYEARLAHLGVEDVHVAARYPRQAVGLYALGTASLLLFWLPLAALGTLLSWLPYRLCGVLARFGRSQDLPATFKLFGGFFLFPLVWLLEALAVGAWLGWAAGLALLFLVAPGTSWIAMRFHERHEQLWAEAEAWLLLRTRGPTARRLRSERDALRAEVAQLAARMRRGRGREGNGAGRRPAPEAEPGGAGERGDARPDPPPSR